MSFLLFSGFILYEKGLEQPELFIFVAVELFSTSKNIQFEQNEACLSSGNFPKAIAEAGRKNYHQLSDILQLSGFFYQAELKFTLTESHLNK